jgi:parvulin-like peptidyl-prolyl isomerase
MKSQGIASEQDLRGRLAAQIQQEKLIALRIAPLVKVSDEEARKWFDSNQQAIALPERVEARHLFLPTLDHPSEEAKQKLAAALVVLTEKKKDFTTLAQEISEDPASKGKGGALGWMTRDRLPADFAAALFSLDLTQAQLVRTTLGWHLVEVTGRKPAAPRTYEQAKPEIFAALEAIKRRQATEDFRKSLRASEVAKIEIFADSTARPQPASGMVPPKAPIPAKKAVQDEPVSWRTMVIAAALILSPLFAGWALAKRQPKSGA